MRAVEFIFESYYTSELKSDLEDILVANKANGSNMVSTSHVVNVLVNMGYSVTVDSLLSLLAQDPMVFKADEEHIYFEEPDKKERSPEDNKKVVQQLASKAAKRDLD